MRTTRRRWMMGAAATAAVTHAGFATAACTATSRRHARVREVLQVIAPSSHTDGAGVKLKKLLGGRGLPMLDPFLMLDEFKSHRPEDYVAGFPTHPHRGFQTVTIMLDGEVHHADSVGNRGVVGAGAVQWMTAGRGILHSEMPRAATPGGLLHGFQLWVNLPASQKMSAPRYQEIAASAFPTLNVADAQVRLIAGQMGGTRGPVEDVAVAPLVFDARLEDGARLRHDVPESHALAVCTVDGGIRVGAQRTLVPPQSFAVLGAGDVLDVVADGRARLLVFAGQPIGEPVARRGPFVMNTDAELRQAFEDYRSGRLIGG